MARVPFKQIDILRAIKGAKAAGIAIGQIEIDPCTGRILIRTTSENSEPARNGLDKWLKRHESSS